MPLARLTFHKRLRWKPALAILYEQIGAPIVGRSRIKVKATVLASNAHTVTLTSIERLCYLGKIPNP
jgi:hypothetical protein